MVSLIYEDEVLRTDVFRFPVCPEAVGVVMVDDIQRYVPLLGYQVLMPEEIPEKMEQHLHNALLLESDLKLSANFSKFSPVDLYQVSRALSLPVTKIKRLPDQ